MCITFDFEELSPKGDSENNGETMNESISKIDGAFAAACELFSDELFDGCMERGISKLEKGSQKLSFQKFRTPGINSKLIHYFDSDNMFGIIFEKSIGRGEESFHVMQAFKVSDSPGQPSDIIYPFSMVSKPSEVTVAFLMKIISKGIAVNFL